MNIFRNVILLSIVTIFGMNGVDGMTPGQGSGSSSSGGSSSNGHKHGRGGSEKTEGHEEKRSHTEMIRLKSNDGVVIEMHKDAAKSVSQFLGNMCDACESGGEYTSIFFSGDVLRELVNLMEEEYNLLQAGMSLEEIINLQKMALPKLGGGVKLVDAVKFFGCDIMMHVLGVGQLTTLYDYFVSGMLPLRLVALSPNILNLVSLHEEVSKHGSINRIAVKTASDSELFCFYHKLPNGDLKTEVRNVILNAVSAYDGNFAAMPMQLAVTSCLLDVPRKGQILSAFGIDELRFNESVLPAIESRKLSASHCSNPLALRFMIECARQLQVAELSLSDNNLTTLPAEIGQLQGLTKLCVSNNKLTALPQEIGQLQRLTEFYVSYNELTALPPEIGQLKKLTHLVVSYNQLTALPPEIGQLWALKFLNVCHNQLTALPPEIGQLQALKWLDVLWNQLTALPPEIGQLLALTTLDVSYNQLMVLPSEIGQSNTEDLRVYFFCNPYARIYGGDCRMVPGHQEQSDFGINCVDGMKPGQGSGSSNSGGSSSNGHKHGRGGSEKTEGHEEKRSHTEMLRLKSNDGVVIEIRKDAAESVSQFFGNMCDACERGGEDTSIPFSGDVLRELVNLMEEEYNLLQVGMSLKEIINLQKMALPKLGGGVKLVDAAKFFGCDIMMHVLGVGQLTTLYDYFVSGVFPLRLVALSPNILNLVSLHEEVSKHGSINRIAVKMASDSELFCFYHKLPNGDLKTEVRDIILNAVSAYYDGNFAIMPVRLAATSCLLDVPRKGEILRDFGIDELRFNESVLPAIESRKLSASHCSNPLALRFMIECARQLQVAELSLLNNNLTTLPAEIGQLQELTQLDVSWNQLTALPAEIGQLQALTNLRVAGNQLTALPPEIGQLLALTTLDVSGNQLTVLPPEIGQLWALKVLNVFCNQLTALPAEIGQLWALKILDVLRNRLIVLPAEIGQLQSLIWLRVRDNQLTALPAEIGQLQELTQLDVQGNQLAALPPEIGQLWELEFLNVSANQLAALPPEIGQLQALKRLWVRDNQLTALPSEIGQLQSLIELLAFNNRLLVELPLEMGQHNRGELQVFPGFTSRIIFPGHPEL